MIDTLKLGIPLSKGQHSKLVKLALAEDKFQQVMFNPHTGETRFLYYRGLADTDSASYHREVRWDIPATYRQGETYLYVELSLPKYWYGHNIRLLYDWMLPLQSLKSDLEGYLHCRFCPIEQWQLWRLDPCYAWNLGTFENAKAVLESLKRHKFPYKKAEIYEDSICFPGKTYSAKFYLKYPEFQVHDKPAMLKARASDDFVKHLEGMSHGVLRFEGTMRRKWLRRSDNVPTIGKLATSKIGYSLRGNWPECDNDAIAYILVILSQYEDRIRGSLSTGMTLTEKPGTYRLIYNDDDLLGILPVSADSGPMQWGPSPLYNGHLPGIYTAPIEDDSEDPTLGDADQSGHYEVREQDQDVIRSELVSCDGSRSLTILEYDRSTEILRLLLDKFLGPHKGMNTFEQVESLLLEHYKPVKAARLASFWLYVQNAGSDRAKTVFGERSYYASKRDLKSAGVSLIELPKAEPGSNAELLRDFRIEVPSRHVVNGYDDQRDSENLFNFFQAQTTKLGRSLGYVERERVMITSVDKVEPGNKNLRASTT